MVLFLVEHRSRGSTLAPKGLALVIALAIGFQNLTEGLVFGSSWVAGAMGLTTVVFVGFFLQNITEGLPSTSPLVGSGERHVGLVATFFLVGGLPTILGGVGGISTTAPRSTSSSIRSRWGPSCTRSSPC
jgi:zinc transporter ZupT